MVNHQKNLARMVELVNLCFTLKAAWLRRLHPEAGAHDIRRMIAEGILRRKEAAWTSAHSS